MADNYLENLANVVNTSADKPESKPSRISKKNVFLLVIGVSVVLQGIAFASKSRFLSILQHAGGFGKKERLYKVLIFGSKEGLSQRLDFLREIDGVWQLQFSCAEDTEVVVRVGRNRTDFEGQTAVVFNMDEPAVIECVGMLVSMPSPPEQAWIYFGRESAVRMRWLFKPRVGSLPLHGMWSYQRDSEVSMKYGYFVPGVPATNETLSVDQWLRGKTKLVAWMARNCYVTFWPRSAFVASLREHIPVDIYGNCGNLMCPFEPKFECEGILKQYKFYLALESAECDDYATEKLWENAYLNGIVPIVYGAQREFYVQAAPPDSFIYAGDFNSTKDLADFLLYLDKNPKLYAKYFAWRYAGHIEIPKIAGRPFRPVHFCLLIPFVDKVRRGEVQKKRFSKHPYYSSCANLKGRKATFHPSRKITLHNWKPMQ